MAGQAKKKPGFSEAEYKAQRDALDAQIRVADDDHHRAGYRQLLGEAGQDDVDKALVTLDALKAKRRTLDAAWGEVQRRNADAIAEAKRTEQSDTSEEVKRLLTARLDAVGSVEAAARQLGEAYTSFSDASQRIRYLAGRLWAGHSQDKNISRETLSFVHSEVDGDRMVHLVAGLLFEAGVDLSKARPAADRFDYKEQGNLPTFVEKVNDRILFRIGELCPDLATEEAGAA